MNEKKEVDGDFPNDSGTDGKITFLSRGNPAVFWF